MSNFLRSGELSVEDTSTLYCDFDSLPIKNQITDQVFIPMSGSGGSIESGRFGSSFRMDKNTKLAYTGRLDVSSQMTFSFWLRSINYGIVYDQSDPEIFYETKVPVLGKAVWVLRPPSDNVTIDVINSSFLIYEKCNEDNTNSIVIELYNREGIYSYETEGYEVNRDNHFYIVYDGLASAVIIYINGVKSVLVESSPGALRVPGYLSSSSLSQFSINEIAPGIASSIIGSGALIEDLLIINKALDNEVLMKKVINRGIRESFSFDGSPTRQKQSLPLPYREVSNNYITSVAGNSLELYLGSNNGDIYRGSSTLWSSRKNFVNLIESSRIKIIKYKVGTTHHYDTTPSDGVVLGGYGIELE